MSAPSPSPPRPDSYSCRWPLRCPARHQFRSSHCPGSPFLLLPPAAVRCPVTPGLRAQVLTRVRPVGRQRRCRHRLTHRPGVHSHLHRVSAVGNAVETVGPVAGLSLRSPAPSRLHPPGLRIQQPVHVRPVAVQGSSPLARWRRQTPCRSSSPIEVTVTVTWTQRSCNCKARPSS